MSSPKAEAPAQEEFLTVLENAYHQVKRMRRSIRMGDSLARGLGLDSLAALEILLVLEQHYGLELVDTEEVAGVETVAELFALVSRLVVAAPSRPA